MTVGPPSRRPSSSGWPVTLVGGLAVCAVGAAVATLVIPLLGTEPDPQGPGARAGLAPLVRLAVVVAIIVAGQVATGAWAWARRPGWRAVVLTQAPFLLAYVTVPIWWSVGDWDPAYILWGAAALSALAWLTVWFLRDPRVARRAVVFLSAVALLFVVNGLAVSRIAWRATNGFGLLGQRTPAAAFDALRSTSCLGTMSFYADGNNTVEADCPSGPDGNYYEGDYDEDGFDDNTCGGQPREAFERWWGWNEEYQIEFSFEFTELSSTVDGDEAMLTFEAELVSAFHPGEEEPWRVRVDKATESWTVHAERGLFTKGWKVCRIDVADPIQARFEPGP